MLLGPLEVPSDIMCGSYFTVFCSFMVNSIRVNQSLVRLLFLVTIAATFVRPSDQFSNPATVSELEKQFLSSLGLQDRPAITRRQIRIADAVLEEYFNKTGIRLDQVAELKGTDGEGLVTFIQHFLPQLSVVFRSINFSQVLLPAQPSSYLGLWCVG